MTHVATCQGRDHLVNIRSGRHNLVIVDLHFEPELTLRQLQGRLHIPVVWFPFWAILCDPEEGRFNVWNQTNTDGDPPGKTAVFHSFFPYVLEVAQSDNTRKNATALGLYAPCQRLIVSLSIYPWLRHVISCARLMLVRTLGRKLFRVDHAAVRLVIRKPSCRGHQNKRIPRWMSKHPIFGSILQQLHDDHNFSPDPFCALAEFKVLLHKAKEITTRSC